MVPHNTAKFLIQAVTGVVKIKPERDEELRLTTFIINGTTVLRFEYNTNCEPIMINK